MVRRSKGERAETYFDSIDLQILEKLDTAQNIHNSPEGYSVLDLVSSLKIKHKNLKPHIDKLLKLGLIFAYRDDENKLRLWTGKANMRYIFQDDLSIVCHNNEEIKKAKKQMENENALLQYLQKVRGIKQEEALRKEIFIDLRKKDLSHELSGLLGKGKKDISHSNPSSKKEDIKK